MLIGNFKLSRVLLPLAVLSKNNAIVAALSYFLTITLANHLGPEQFGVYSHVLIVASVVSIFINFGTDQTAAILHSRSRNTREVFNSIYLFRVVIAIPTLAVLLILYYKDFQFVTFVLCLLLANYNLAFLYEIRRCNEKYSYIYLLERVSYIGAAFLLIQQNHLELNYLYAMLLFFTATSISYQLIDNASILRCEYVRTHRAIYKIVQENFPLVVIAFSTYAYGGFTRLVLEGNLGIERLGIYSAGWQLVTISTIFQAQVSRLWRVPISDRVYALDALGLRSELHSYLLLSTLPMVLVCGVFIFFSDLIVRILFTDSYMELSRVLPILGVYLVVINLAGLVDMFWVALRRNTLYMFTNLFFGLMLLGFLWVFSSLMKMVEFAAAAVFFHFLTTITLAILGMKVFRLRLNDISGMES